ncbi:MAG TPA: DUF58 domain-containing protein [Treponemataceae bacterium]|nr:DUF58 domain-containing protein [Treponemataceae bacterium]HQL33776.1 DUF58 domain-containing protein [Treponemataceae bacterium]
MIDAALRQRVRELEVRALKLVSHRFMGEWASNMRGQGLEFRDLREYVPGDDIRRIDWKATARSGRAQLRQFTEERQQHIWFALDRSASMEGNKARLAGEILAVLGWAAVTQGDPFGLVTFTDSVEKTILPARGEANLWAAVEAAVSGEPSSNRTDFAPLFRFFMNTARARSTLIILSDWSAPDLTSGLPAGASRSAGSAWASASRRLGALALAHDVIALRVRDPSVQGGYPAGLAPVVDPESGKRMWVDLSSKKNLELLRTAEEKRTAALNLSFRKAGVWSQTFDSGADFVPPLMELFRRRDHA